MTTSRRLTAEEEHEIAAQLLQQQAAAMKASLDGVAVVDRNGRYVVVNEAHARMHGYATPQELVGLSYREHFAPEQLPQIDQEILPTLWKGGQWRGECLGRRRDGGTFPKEISLSRIDDERGQATGLVAIVRDITERKKAQQEHALLLEMEKTARAEAEAASRSKDEFLAVVSHELRTPMTAILGWTWLLRSGDVAPQEVGKALEVIERNMKMQAQIIEDLLDVSSIVTGKLHLNIKPVDLGAPLTLALDNIKTAAARSRVRVEPQLPTNVLVNADAHRLQQVFWNLLSNAIKFNKEGGRVSVSVRVDGPSAVITVEDDGQGIESALLPEIFEPFRQGEDSLTRQHRGLGLGLAIVRHLVEQHGGSISASSAGAGKGSCFTVMLPLSTPKPPEPAAKAAASNGAAADPMVGLLTGVSALVVDDEPDTLAVIAELLKHCGASVTEAPSGQDALTELSRQIPRLLVSDLAMPGIDGYSLIRKVRDLTGGGRIRAVALSARTRDEDRQKALEAGFDRFLGKPVDLDELVSVLKDLTA